MSLSRPQAVWGTYGAQSDNRFEPLAGNDWHEEDKDDDGDDDDISVTIRSEWPVVEESSGVYVASSVEPRATVV
nr:hypothetical protein BaRGS_017573 [Batillaria attramentaria]